MSIFGISGIFAQEPKDTILSIAEIEVKVAKLKKINPPYSASTISIQPFVNQGASINEYLYSLSGLFSLSPNNYAQDSRLSSRGFGARSAFGVRGIKIITDDLPDSSPDGQAQMDNIDFSSLRKIELLRGPHSGIYGNNSGGVLNLYTADLDQPSNIDASYKTGSYHFQQWRLAANHNNNKLKCSFNFNHTRLDGYRIWSQFKNTLLNGIMRYDINAGHTLKLILNYVNSPLANDAGGLNLEEIAIGKNNANQRNLGFKAGESMWQSKAGLIYTLTQRNDRKLMVKSYFIKRLFENKLPFESNGAVTIDRQLYGLSLDYSFNFKFAKRKFSNQVGIEYDDQNDLRRQYKNVVGVKGPVGFDQNEFFKSKSAYILTNVAMGKKWSVNVNLRYDGIYTKVVDHFISNGDQSGIKEIRNINYSFSLDHIFSKYLNAAAIVSTGFESPTLNELSNNPGGLGGFNTNLKGMNSKNYELNIKTKSNALFSAQVSLFYIASQNEITAYELPGQNGRSYYRNAGSTKRKGIEVEGQYKCTGFLSTSFSYTLSQFNYGNFLEFDGKILPGVPCHMAYINLTINPLKNIVLIFENRYASKIYLNNSNSDFTKGFVESNAKFKYSYAGQNCSIHFFCGVNNVFNQFYFSNLRINAAGGRYYEAAQPVNFYVGCSVQNIWSKKPK
jgi:iron complex outermembrane recepter protein